MSLLHYQPWNLLEQFHNELNRSVAKQQAQDVEGSRQAASNDWMPAVDIKEEKDAFLILADLPGVDPKAIEIHMEDGILSIRGQRNAYSEQEREYMKRVERASGNFYRRFHLPDTADAEHISAKGNHGVLEIRIPKQQKAQPRRIEIEH